jgi:hypothetical protein
MQPEPPELPPAAVGPVDPLAVPPVTEALCRVTPPVVETVVLRPPAEACPLAPAVSPPLELAVG